MKLIMILAMLLSSFSVMAGGREYAIQFEGEISETETEFNGGAPVESETFTIEGAAKRNFGRFEVGGFLAYSSNESGGAEDDDITVGVLFDINLIENKGATFVPYIELKAGYITGETSGVDETGFLYGAALGGKFFIAGGLALTAEYAYLITDVERDTTPETEIEQTKTGINLGLAYYF